MNLFLKRLIPAALGLLLAVPAALRGEELKGRIYISMDDEATIYVNGKEVFAPKFGQSQSGEMTLSEGDRLVARLTNDTRDHRFLMVFMSSDEKRIINFRATDFKIFPDLERKDFTDEEFRILSRRPKKESLSNSLGFKHYSDSLWGDSENCVVGCVITRNMFSNRPY